MAAATLTAAATLIHDAPNSGTRTVARVAIDDNGSGPYFSLTGEVYYRHGTWSGAAQQRNGREPDAGGCVHDEILHAFPRLAPFAALHLADAATGEPMHALANARYFWRDEHYAYELLNYGAGYLERHGTGAERAARTLRVDVADLPDPDTTDDDAFSAYVDTLRPRWAIEAAAARELLSTLT